MASNGHPPRSDADVEPCEHFEDWPASVASPEIEGYCFDCGWHRDDHDDEAKR